MNLPTGKAIVYLSGPIADCDDKECKEWRVEATKRFEEKVLRVLDPMRRDYRHIGNMTLKAKKIVENDKIDILISDYVLVNQTRLSVGTSMEMLYGYMHDKIVVVCYPETQLSPWTIYHSSYKSTSLTQCIDWMIEHAYASKT